MTVSPIRALNSTFELTHHWIMELTHIGHFATPMQAYSALRAVLHGIRDRLRVDDAAHLASQLPLLIRGVYYEGWKPAATPMRIRTLKEFVDYVGFLLGRNSEVDPFVATQAVFTLLSEMISPGELGDIIHVLPPEIGNLWRNARRGTVREPVVM